MNGIKSTMIIPGDRSYGEVRVLFEDLNQAYAFKRLVYSILQEAPALAGCEEENGKELENG